MDAANPEDRTAFEADQQRAIDEGIATAKGDKAIPRTLYHYTDAQGLMGIQGDQCFWATNARFLNDEFELSWSANVFGAELEKTEPRSDREGELLLRMDDATSLINSGIEVFCCSFSEQPDDLNQWRGYAGGVSPYCLGVASNRLSAQIQNSELFSVEYDEARQNAIARQVIDITLDLYRSHETPADKREARQLMGNCAHAFRIMTSYASLRFKSPHWASEKEWRLVSISSDERELEGRLLFRAGRFGVIPYIKLKMGNIGPRMLPITEVIVGPTALRDATVQATKMYFRNQPNMHGPTVTASTVPIR